jgi:cleavage and polyadenylation specificity factor subunit 2
MLTYQRNPLQKNSGDDDDMDVDATEGGIPTKSIAFDIDIDIACTIKYIDFEGRSDGRSMTKILARVAPQKLVRVLRPFSLSLSLSPQTSKSVVFIITDVVIHSQIVVHGEPERVQSLAEYCQQNLKCDQVFAPRDKQTLAVASDTNLFKVPLPDELLASLNIVKVGDTELALVNARIQPRQQASSGEAMDVDSSMEFVLAPSQGRLQNATLLGDVKLSDFRQLLTQRGFRTEFKSSGVLTVNELLTVRKEGDEANARLIVDGPICEDYFLVRELLFSRLTVL